MKRLSNAATTPQQLEEELLFPATRHACIYRGMALLGPGIVSGPAPPLVRGLWQKLEAWPAAGARERLQIANNFVQAWITCKQQHPAYFEKA